MNALRHMHLVGDICDLDIDPLDLLKKASSLPISTRIIPDTHVFVKKLIITPTSVSSLIRIDLWLFLFSCDFQGKNVTSGCKFVLINQRFDLWKQ